MQIFNDKKKRIGTLSGFKDREIITTLDSGDKELSFNYPVAGALVDLLKEEYYIRTKTDEYVIKAVEKGEQFNKYTAVLNVEELEGAAFPYGFESDEQTIKACLEFAFKGTGWHQMMLLYEMEKDEIEVQEEQNRIIERMEESE